MIAMADGRGGGRVSAWRLIGWGGAAALLCVPALAMRFAPQAGFDWGKEDFIVAAVLFGMVGAGVELVVRASRSMPYRMGAFAAILTAFLTIWVNLAVGMIGAEGNPYNLAFGGVILIALVGAAVARFRAAGLARAMAIAAAAQAAAAAAGMAVDLRGGVFSLIFAGFWLGSALLFRRAARQA
jgi:hypothetical protein